MEMKQSYEIFISYRRYDEQGNVSGRDQARLISKQLQLMGYHTFFDYSEIKDDEFDKIIIPAVENCKVFILVLTKDTLNRCKNEDDWVRQEIETAIRSGCKIINVTPDNAFNGWPDTLPESLMRIKNIQISDIHLGSLFEESIKKMSNERIASVLNNSRSKIRTGLFLSAKNNCKSVNPEEVNYEDYIVDLGDVQLKMIKIIGCEFELWSKEMVPVKVPDFWISETTITIDFWEEVMGSRTPPKLKEKNFPKDFNCIDDCVRFINQLNYITEGIRPKGTKFRLPTEIEWEYAARGGHKQKQYIYSGSNNADEVAWFFRDFNKYGMSFHPVGEKKPNSIGLYDMSGNIGELCVKYDHIEFYLNGLKTDFISHPLEHILTLKGGCWAGGKSNCLIRHEGVQYITGSPSTGIRIILSNIFSNAF